MADKKYEVVQIYFRKDKKNEMKLLNQLKEIADDSFEFSNLNSLIRYIISQYVKENYKKPEEDIVDKDVTNSQGELDLKKRMISNISESLDEL